MEVNDGWAAFARLGYRFNPSWRVELEGGYRSGDIGRIRHSTGSVPSGVCNFTPATGPCFSPEGDVESTTLMANVIYDIGGEYWGVRPFVGLGVGVNRVATEFVGSIRGQRGVSIAADDSSTKFAAQAIAGLSYAVGDRANIDLTYRYLTGDFEYATSTSSALAVNNYGTFEGDYDDSHTVTLGLRYAFGAASAAAAASPASSAAASPAASAASAGSGRTRVRGVLRLGSLGPDGRSPFGGDAGRQLRQVGSSDARAGRRLRRHLRLGRLQRGPVEPSLAHRG